MKSIADALVYAVAYINCRDEEDGGSDDDVRALESIASVLQNSTPAEQDALAAAAERALAAEKSSPRLSQDFLRAFSHWMENLFAEGWQGNQRIAE